MPDNGFVSLCMHVLVKSNNNNNNVFTTAAAVQHRWQWTWPRNLRFLDIFVCAWVCNCVRVCTVYAISDRCTSSENHVKTTCISKTTAPGKPYCCWHVDCCSILHGTG